MLKRLQINIALYCFLWHLIWLFSCTLFYIHDGNSCCVKKIPFAQSINYRPIVAVQTEKVEPTAACVSPGHHPTGPVPIAAVFRITAPRQRVAGHEYPAPCAATAYTPSHLAPSRASPA